MAVQVAPAQARDFIETMAADGGAVAALAGKPADGKALPTCESFGGILAGARLGMLDEAPARAGEIENAAFVFGGEEFSLPAAPIANGVERMMGFTGAPGAETPEGDVPAAAGLAGDVSEKASRFDPDLILGGGFAGDSLHELIEDFLKKFDVRQEAKQQPEPSEVPAQPEITAEPLPDENGALLPGPNLGCAVLPDEGEAPEGQDIPDVPMLPAAPGYAVQNAETDDSDSKDKDTETETEESAETDATPADRIVLNAALAETLGVEGVSRVKADDRAIVADQAAKPDSDAKQDGLGLTPRRAGAASSVLKEHKLNRQVSGALEDDASEPNVGALSGFESELVSAARAGRAAPEQEVTLPSMTQPGVTYELRGDNLLGSGVGSVLEFMKNDGINEARIVVEPPALGRVDVSLQASGSGVEAVFKVDNEALKQVLQQQLDLLKTSLEAQGIHVSSLAVDIKNREEQKGRPDLYGGKGKAHRADDYGDDEDEPRIARIDLERGLLHWVA